ncbi:MAG: thioredoxin-disulfide reductase [Deferribacteraceae bacterium]|jgi:thioredoxin reductase (NADPH)|nr:thioredoxin-disulfide reductase [Deferribacteraceae bacterium]
MHTFFDATTIKDEYDVVIIGGGPAGCTAAIYTSRDELSTLVLEKSAPGGQMGITAHVDNYPGFNETISGYDLSIRFHEHAKRFGATFKYGMCTDLQVDGAQKLVYIEGRVKPVAAKAVIIATGCTPRKLNVDGESKFFGRGVSTCASCDGGFYKDKIVATVGGGDTALEETAYLTRFASKVYLIHRRDEFRASKIAQRLVKEDPKIEIVYDSVVTSINGEKTVSSVSVENVKTHEKSEFTVDGMFIFIGQEPQVAPFDKVLPVNNSGFIIAGEDTCTPLAGVYVAGDIRAKEFRQIGTAISDGIVAARMAVRYLQELNVSHS